MVEIAERTAREQGALRVISVTVEIGELSGVVPEAVEFCFEACAKGHLHRGRKPAHRTHPRPGQVRRLRGGDRRRPLYLRLPRLRKLSPWRSCRAENSASEKWRSTRPCAPTAAVRLADHHHYHDHEHGHGHDRGPAEGTGRSASRRTSSPRTTAWPRPTGPFSAEKGLFVLNLVSSPGSGKTSILERTLTDLSGRLASPSSKGTSRPPTTPSASPPPASPSSRSTPEPAAIWMPTWSATAWSISTWKPPTS